MKTVWTLLTMLLFVFSGCGDTAPQGEPDFPEEAKSVSRMAAAPMTAAGISRAAPSAEGGKVIRTGQMTLRVDDADAAKRAVTTLLEKVQGYVTNENSNQYNGRTTYNLTMRIPQTAFREVVDALAGLGVVESRNVDARNVTEAHADLNRRIAVSTALEQRYLQLLEKANNVNDMLQIEREVAKLRGEIERMQARLAHMDKQVEFATLTLSCYVKYAPASLPFGGKIADAFADGFALLKSMLLSVIAGWPIVLFLIGFGWLVRRWLRGMRH